MSIKLSDLPSLRDRFVQVEYVTDSGNQTVHGKLIAVSQTAIVVQDRLSPHMIMTEDILDVDEILRYTVRGGVLIRRISKTTTESVRQHLLDRHGWTAERVRAMTDEEAMKQHEAIDHGPLGHLHGQTEKGKPGRKPRMTGDGDVANLVPVQRTHGPDGDPAHVRD